MRWNALLGAVFAALLVGVASSSARQFDELPYSYDSSPLWSACAVLHYVRRDEVRAYIRKLERSQSVSCDDGTPPDKLGAE
jgi:hypothetical protein